MSTTRRIAATSKRIDVLLGKAPSFQDSVDDTPLVRGYKAGYTDLFPWPQPVTLAELAKTAKADYLKELPGPWSLFGGQKWADRKAQVDRVGQALGALEWVLDQDHTQGNVRLEAGYPGAADHSMVRVGRMPHRLIVERLGDAGVDTLVTCDFEYTDENGLRAPKLRDEVVVTPYDQTVPAGIGRVAHDLAALAYAPKSPKGH